MTVVDSSPIVDVLMRHDSKARAEVERLISEDRPLHAPDVIVFEVVSALRRAVFDGRLSAKGGGRAIGVLGDLPIELFPSLPLRHAAWHMRESLGAADALFVALAQAAKAPLATKDRGLAAAARGRGVEVVLLED
jgi:predicted nucleic acid-binding protein